jgi:hypothetical protein
MNKYVEAERQAWREVEESVQSEQVFGQFLSLCERRLRELGAEPLQARPELSLARQARYAALDAAKAVWKTVPRRTIEDEYAVFNAEMGKWRAELKRLTEPAH